jgi:phosphate transport system substrate-binding protein
MVAPSRACLAAPRRTATALAVALVLALLLAAGALPGCQGDPPPPPPSGPPTPLEADVGVARVVGTGAMTPLAARLAEAWARRGGMPRVEVDPSVGSGGGVRAAFDGAVDIGLISRSLSASERGLGVEVVNVARGAVVIAAHPGVSVEGLSHAELVAMYAGQQAHFQGGAPAVLLLRDRDESANVAIELLLPELKRLREEAYVARRFRVLYHDDAMREALASTPGAIGVFDQGAIVAGATPLKVLSLGGVTPTLDAVADGTWRATRDLAFVLRPDRRPRLEAFLAFVASPEGRAITRASGFLPLPAGNTP